MSNGLGVIFFLLKSQLPEEQLKVRERGLFASCGNTLLVIVLDLLIVGLLLFESGLGNKHPAFMNIDPMPFAFNYDLALLVAHVGIFEFGLSRPLSLKHLVRRDLLPRGAVLNRGFRHQLISSASQSINGVADSLILDLVLSLEICTEVFVDGP